MLLLICAAGLNTVVITKMEQMMCASGYTDQFTGLVTSLFLFCGTFACVPVTIILGKFFTAPAEDFESNACRASIRNPTLNYTKTSLTVGAVATVAMLLLAQMPDQKVWKSLDCLDYFAMVK